MKLIRIALLFLLGLLFASVNALSQNLSYESGYVPLKNNINMYYEIHGEGDPLVLIHGSFMTIDSNFGQLIPELAKTNQVIAVELQGHGHTADTERAFSYPHFADDISDLLGHLKIERANILGYSLGASVGLQTAISYPEKVGKIIFISSVYKFEGWTPPVRESFANMKPEFLTNTPLKAEYDRIAPNKDHWNDFVTRMIAFENTPFDLGLDNIKKLNSPILIINGDYDGVDVSHSMELFKAFGGGGFGIMEPLSESRFAIIPGTTHVTVMMQTEDLLRIIKPFLAKQSEANN